MLDYDSVVQRLRKSVCSVEFKKVNGETRVMPCTLDASYIDESKYSFNPEDVERRSANKSVVRAFAIDIREWRSFKIENLVSITEV